MLQKTMKKVLDKKISKWLTSISDQKVVSAIEKDLIITGGCFTSMMENSEPNDFDCYFRTKETILLVANYYTSLWNENKKEQENKLGAKCNVMVLDCDNPSKEILDYYKVEDIRDSKAIMLSNFDEGRVKIIFPSDGIAGNPEDANNNEELGVDSANEIVEELDEIKASEIMEEEKKEYYPVFFSTNAITLSNKIQIVCRFYGKPSEIHDTYDFAHTMAYYEYGENKLIIPEGVYDATINKTLIYTGSKYPVCSIFRIRKFINRGWKINAGQMLKICVQISELDLMDITVLEDQLIGVDSVYFMNIINIFKQREHKDKDFKLTSSYLLSIIDKIF